MPPPSPRSGIFVRLLLLPLCGAVLVVSACSAEADSATTDDAHVVFCLSPAQRVNLAAAAVSLGLVAPGKHIGQVVAGNQELSLENWRTRNGAGFTRACNALVPVAPVASDDSSSADMFLATLNALIPLLIGTALGLLTSAYRDGLARRRLQADELESITEQFISTAGRFAHAWATPGGTQPDGSPLLDVRWRLAASLRKASVLRARCAPAVKEARSLIDGAVLGDSLLDGWAGLDQEKQEARVREVQGDTAKLTVQTGRVADTLRRSRWAREKPHPAPGAQPVATP